MKRSFRIMLLIIFVLAYPVAAQDPYADETAGVLFFDKSYKATVDNTGYKFISESGSAPSTLLELFEIEDRPSGDSIMISFNEARELVLSYTIRDSAVSRTFEGFLDDGYYSVPLRYEVTRKQRYIPVLEGGNNIYVLELFFTANGNLGIKLLHERGGDFLLQAGGFRVSTQNFFKRLDMKE